MSWLQGFVICDVSVAGSVESTLARDYKSCRLVSKNSEVAYAFGGRSVPEFDEDSEGSAGAFALDTRNGGYVVGHYLPSFFVLEMGTTSWLVLPREVEEKLQASPLLRSMLLALGKPSEQDSSQNLIRRRWDDLQSIGSRRFGVESQKLALLERRLDTQGLCYGISYCCNGYVQQSGEVTGYEGEPLCGDAFISLQWTDPSGTSSVSANSGGEFDTESSDVPEFTLD